MMGELEETTAGLFTIRNKTFETTKKDWKELEKNNPELVSLYTTPATSTRFTVTV